MPDHQIEDLDLRLLAEVATALHGEYQDDDDEWANSPFGWIKQQPSRRVGKIGEQLVARWCTRNGFSVSPAPTSDSDRVIDNLKMEIKFSTLWKGGFFKFQQLRNQEYDAVFCLGISPFAAYAWVIPKAIIWQQPAGVQPQHGGQQGRDTLWLQVQPGDEPQWLRRWGGTLSEARAALGSLTHP